MSRNLHADAIALFPYNTGAAYDYKAWAKRILWRKEQGDTELLMVQTKFAEEAMNRSIDETISRASAATVPLMRERQQPERQDHVPQSSQGNSQDHPRRRQRCA